MATGGDVTLTANNDANDILTITNTQGTAANAIDINATAGGIDIDADANITIDTTDTSNGVKIATATSGVPTTAGWPWRDADEHCPSDGPCGLTLRRRSASAAGNWGCAAGRDRCGLHQSLKLKTDRISSVGLEGQHHQINTTSGSRRPDLPRCCFKPAVQPGTTAITTFGIKRISL